MPYSPTLQSNVARALKGEEGSSQYAYKDSRGFDSIGIGRLCDKKVPGSGLSMAEQLYLFGNDLTRFEAEIDEKMPWVHDLDDARCGAILNMVFEMGVTGVLKFVNSTTLLRAKRYEEAAAAFLQSDWAKQVPERAKRVTDQIRTGIWQYAPGA